MASTYLLVHGSWQGGWCWDEVARHLRCAGHQVLAPTLPGHHSVPEDRSHVTQDDYLATALAALEEAGSDPVVLVGHSGGGPTVTQLAEQRPERVKHLVYLAALVVHDGEALADVLPHEFVSTLRRLAEASPDRSMSLPWELWQDNFIQTADEDLARRTYQRLCPEPYRPVFEPVPLQRLSALNLPKTFIAMKQDKTMPPGFWQPGMTSRVGEATIVEIDGDHEVMLTAPGTLAGALQAAVSEATGA